MIIMIVNSLTVTDKLFSIIDIDDRPIGFNGISNHLGL